MSNNMKEKCFAYINKKNLKWLKVKKHFNIYSEKFDYSHTFYDTFNKDVLYSNKNDIKEHFAVIKLNNKEEWQLMEISVDYCFEALEC